MQVCRAEPLKDVCWPQVATVLLEAGADPDATNDRGEDPIGVRPFCLLPRTAALPMLLDTLLTCLPVVRLHEGKVCAAVGSLERPPGDAGAAAGARRPDE